MLTISNDFFPFYWTTNSCCSNQSVAIACGLRICLRTDEFQTVEFLLLFIPIYSFLLRRYFSLLIVFGCHKSVRLLNGMAWEREIGEKQDGEMEREIEKNRETVTMRQNEAVSPEHASAPVSVMRINVCDTVLCEHFFAG